MNKHWQYQSVLHEEEKKIARLLDAICKDPPISQVNNASAKYALSPFPTASSTYQQSVGIQVDEDELEIIVDDGLQGFVGQKALQRWDTILEEQIRADAKSHVSQVRDKMNNQNKTIKDLRGSVIKLMQWKNSTLNHFALLTETFLVRMKSKINVNDTVCMDILDEMVNLFANLEADLTEPIKLPKSIERLQQGRFEEESEDETGNDEEGVQVLADNFSTKSAFTSDEAPASVALSVSDEDHIETKIPFQLQKKSLAVSSPLNSNQPSSVFGKLFQNIDETQQSIIETTPKIQLLPPTHPPPILQEKIKTTEKVHPKKTKRLSVHLLASPMTMNSTTTLTSKSDKKSRRLSVHLLSNIKTNTSGDEVKIEDETVIIEEYVCIECRKNKEMPRILKPDLHDTVHVLAQENEDHVAHLFDLLSRVQSCANNDFQSQLTQKRSADASWIEKRTFILFLLAFELFDKRELTLELAVFIYDKGIQEASKRSLKLRTRLHFNDFIDTLAYLADILQDGSSRSIRLNGLITSISSRIEDLVKNPEFTFKFFSTFWEIGDDRLYNLLHYYRDSLFNLYQQSKNYGVNKNKMKLSESQLVGSGFSAFEIFFINNNIVPEKIPSSAVRRIVQYIKPMFCKEGMSYVMGCLFYATVYIARFQRIHYKRATATNTIKEKNTQEEAWRIMEDLLVRIHRDTYVQSS